MRSRRRALFLAALAGVVAVRGRRRGERAGGPAARQRGPAAAGHAHPRAAGGAPRAGAGGGGAPARCDPRRRRSRTPPERRQRPGRSSSAGERDDAPRRAAAPGDTLTGEVPPPDDLYDRLLEGTDTTAVAVEGAPIRYQGSRLVFYPEGEVIVLEGQAQAEQGGTTLEAERILFRSAEGVVEAFRDASVARGPSKLVADSLFYDRESGSVATFGASVLTENQSETRGVDLMYDLERKSGRLGGGTTQYAPWILHGEDMSKIGESTYLVTQGNFTTCDLPEPHYKFASSEIKMRQEDVIVASPVVLYFSDVPVFFLPWYVEPVTRGRHSGFLRPRIGLNTIIFGSGQERNVQDLGLLLHVRRLRRRARVGRLVLGVPHGHAVRHPLRAPPLVHRRLPRRAGVESPRRFVVPAHPLRPRPHDQSRDARQRRRQLVEQPLVPAPELVRSGGDPAAGVPLVRELQHPLRLGVVRGRRRRRLPPRRQPDRLPPARPAVVDQPASAVGPAAGRRGRAVRASLVPEPPVQRQCVAGRAPVAVGRRFARQSGDQHPHRLAGESARARPGDDRERAAGAHAVHAQRPAGPVRRDQGEPFAVLLRAGRSRPPRGRPADFRNGAPERGSQYEQPLLPHLPRSARPGPGTEAHGRAVGGDQLFAEAELLGDRAGRRAGRRGAADSELQPEPGLRRQAARRRRGRGEARGGGRDRRRRADRRRGRRRGAR